MRQLLHKYRVIIAIICLILAVFTVFLVYRRNSMKIIDADAFNAFAESIEEAHADGTLADQASMRDFITSWADSSGLKYKIDGTGNIIFNTPAAARKKNMSPTVICVGFNYETALSDSKALASAAMMASADISTGRRTVIFFNNEHNSGIGYKSVSKKYFKGKTKVIYLDSGKSSYLSRSSYAQSSSVISIPAGREETTLDTAVRIHITGAQPAAISTENTSYPDPASFISLLLTRLKSKSTVFRIAEINIAQNDGMYPAGCELTILMNSYSVPAFTKYADKVIKDQKNSYGSDYPDLECSYEIVEDPEQLPDTVYDEETSVRLTNVLYTVKNGTYAYGEEDVLPDGAEDEDICGLNCITGVSTADDSITISIVSQAYSDEYMSRIQTDNASAAELFECGHEVTDTVPAFDNQEESLSRTLHSTFEKVHSISGSNCMIDDGRDSCFTPCSYLAKAGRKANIVHIRLSSRKAVALTNAICFYMETKGNLLKL